MYNTLIAIENRYFDLMNDARILYLQGERDDAKQCEAEAKALEPEMVAKRKTHGNYKGQVMSIGPR